MVRRLLPLRPDLGTLPGDFQFGIVEGETSPRFRSTGVFNANGDFVVEGGGTAEVDGNPALIAISPSIPALPAARARVCSRQSLLESEQQPG